MGGADASVRRMVGLALVRRRTRGEGVGGGAEGRGSCVEPRKSLGSATPAGGSSPSPPRWCRTDILARYRGSCRRGAARLLGDGGPKLDGNVEASLGRVAHDEGLSRVVENALSACSVILIGILLRIVRSAPPEAELVVLVDDEPSMLRSLERGLSDSFRVASYESAGAAVERVRAGGVAVVCSDIAMPDMSGLELLRAVRSHDSDLPVMLMTGAPSLETATQAIEHGVFRYLHKPLLVSELSLLIGQASQLHRLARLKREALELHAPGSEPRSHPAEPSFDDVLGSLWLAFQPIVSTSGRDVFGYEALMRSTSSAYPSPSHVLDTAEHLRELDGLGRFLRRRACEAWRDAPADALLFVNLHPKDLSDPDLLDPSSPLAAIADRVVLEITERTSLDGLDDVERTVRRLRDLGFRIAVDDLGAGYAGLTSFVLLEPEIVKLDMSLARGVDHSSVKQKLVGSMSKLCREMGLTLVVEGVETKEERDTLLELGCDLMQGYLFAPPHPQLLVPRF